MHEDKLVPLGTIAKAGRPRSFDVERFDGSLFSSAAESGEGGIDYRCGGGDEDPREKIEVAHCCVDVFVVVLVKIIRCISTFSMISRSDRENCEVIDTHTNLIEQNRRCYKKSATREQRIYLNSRPDSTVFCVD